jgi:hypothetical protein
MVLRAALCVCDRAWRVMFCVCELAWPKSALWWRSEDVVSNVLEELDGTDN